MKTRESTTEAGNKTPAESFPPEEQKPVGKKKTDDMLSILERECEEAKVQLLSDICDLCHQPYVLTQALLEEKCSECTVCQDLEALLTKQRTITTGKVMSIVAEEMHPVEVIDGGTQNAGPSLV